MIFCLKPRRPVRTAEEQMFVDMLGYEGAAQLLGLDRLAPANNRAGYQPNRKNNTRKRPKRAKRHGINK